LVEFDALEDAAVRGVVLEVGPHLIGGGEVRVSRRHRVVGVRCCALRRDDVHVLVDAAAPVAPDARVRVDLIGRNAPLDERGGHREAYGSSTDDEQEIKLRCGTPHASPTGSWRHELNVELAAYVPPVYSGWRVCLAGMPDWLESRVNACRAELSQPGLSLA